MVKESIGNNLTEIIFSQLGKRDIDVSKIVAFGSYAKGDAGDESDLDVIAVSRAFPGTGLFHRIEKAASVHWALAEALRLPMDLLYYSDTEWDADSSLIIREAKREGEVIYEAPTRAAW